jgi:hypothetical protein
VLTTRLLLEFAVVQQRRHRHDMSEDRNNRRTRSSGRDGVHLRDVIPYIRCSYCPIKNVLANILHHTNERHYKMYVGALPFNHT